MNYENLPRAGPRPDQTPLSLWPTGWLIMETSALLNRPDYILMSEGQRAHNDFPANDAERRNFIVLLRGIGWPIRAQ